MKLEYLSHQELKEMVKGVVAKHIPLKEVKLFFFGSRVRGDSFPRSDVDIGIQASRRLPLEIKLGIEEDLEKLPTLYQLELVDFGAAAPRFRKEALKFTESID